MFVLIQINMNKKQKLVKIDILLIIAFLNRILYIYVYG
jgi:hypothetical protein